MMKSHRNEQMKVNSPSTSKDKGNFHGRLQSFLLSSSAGSSGSITASTTGSSRSVGGYNIPRSGSSPDLLLTPASDSSSDDESSSLTSRYFSKAASPTSGGSSSKKNVLRGSTAATPDSISRSFPQKKKASIKRSGSSPDLMEELCASGTEEAFLYHHIKRMNITDKAELLGRVMDEISSPATKKSDKKKRGSPSKKSREENSFSWWNLSPNAKKRTVKKTEKKTDQKKGKSTMRRVRSSGDLGLGALEIPF